MRRDAGEDALDAPPPELRAALTPGIPAIVEDVIAAIGSTGGVSGFSRGALERNLRLGLTDAVDRWFEPARGRPVRICTSRSGAHRRARGAVSTS